MRTNEIITTLQQRGITLRVIDGGLRIGGADKLTAGEKAALRANKSSLLRALSQPTGTPAGTAVVPSPSVTALLPNRTEPPEPGSTTPFNQTALDAVKAGAGCWVWSGVLNEWLFWVRDEERKAKAVSRGIDPGCIWTLEELTGVQGMPPEGLRDVAKIKRQFGGDGAAWRNTGAMARCPSAAGTGSSQGGTVMSFECAPVCLDTPAELPDLAARIEHTAPADCVAELAASVTPKVDWQAVANEYRDLADFFKAQAYQTAAQLAQARMEVAQFRQRLIAAGLLDGP